MNVVGSNRQKAGKNVALSIAEDSEFQSHIRLPPAQDPSQSSNYFEYRMHGHTANPETTGTFFLLLDLMAFFNYYHNNQYVDALDTIKAKLLPLKIKKLNKRFQLFIVFRRGAKKFS
ncbi:nuclear pore protein [Trichonephila clavipes]|nr:nuclear pore protein [Trichonephila clavipes]